MDSTGPNRCRFLSNRTCNPIIEEAQKEIAEKDRRKAIEAIEAEKQKIRERRQRKKLFPWRLKIVNLNKEKEDDQQNY